MKKTKKALIASLFSMLLCVAMLVGSTMAWFTDTASNTGNRIQAGTLDVDLLMYKGSDYESIANETGDIFKEATNAQNSNETLWEPGKTQVVFLAVKNNGSLALKYNVYIDVTDEGLIGSLEYAWLGGVTKEAYDAKGISNWSAITTYVGNNSGSAVTGDLSAGRQVITTGVLDEIANGTTDECDYVALAVHMKEDAGNAYQGKDCIIDVTVVATQKDAEEDAFDNTYDADAEITAPTATSTKTIVAGEDTVIKSALTLSDEENKQTTVTFPKEIAAFTNDDDAVLKITASPTIIANKSFTVSSEGAVGAIDLSVTVDGNPVSEFKDASDQAVLVKIETYIAKNLTNVSLSYGDIETWTPCSSEADVDAEYEFYYDKSTGKLVYMTTHFSTFILGAAESAYIEETNTAYTDITAAIDDAEEGQTIYLLKNATATSDVVVNKAVTVDGNGYTLTGAGYAIGDGSKTGKSGIVINLGNVEESKNVTLKNFMLKNMGNYGAIEVTNGNNNKVNVLIQNVTCDTFYRMGISVHGGNVDIDSCAIDSHIIKASVGNGINFDGYGLSYIIKGTVQNCTITNSSLESGKWVSGGIALWDNVDLEIDNCNITNCNTAISPVGEGNKTKITNTTISDASTGISVNKYLYEDAKTCEVELGLGNDFTCSSKAIYVGIGQGYASNVKLNITGGSYTCNDGYALVLSDYASYHGTEDDYDLNDYFMIGSSISNDVVFNGVIAIAYDAYELSTYEDANYIVNILDDVGIVPEKVQATDCWYSNGSWNNGNGNDDSGIYMFSTIFNSNWIGDGEGIKLMDNLAITGDITCQMTSGSFYLYFQGYTLSGGQIILNSGVSVITDTTGLSAVFGGGTITETDNGNGTYTYACVLDD